jgi:hypothetical protein
MVVRKRDKVVDIKALRYMLRYDEGVKSFRYFKKGKSVIDALGLVEFRNDVNFDLPTMYLAPRPEHDARIVVQPNCIVVSTEDTTKADAVIDAFISRYSL